MLKESLTYYKSFVLILMVLLSSCVNDDSFFSDNTSSNEITSTTALITILNDIKTKNPAVEDNLCFTFKFPLILGYNTSSTIQIDDFQGLIGVISAQSSNFNITGLRFPVEIVFKGTDNVSLIKDEESLISTLRECQIETFRDDFDTLYKQCFKFEYPVVLKTKEEEIRIDDDDSFDRFLVNQGAGYQPDFKFPIKIKVAPEFDVKRVSTYYEFYEIINTCVGCPNARFEIEPLPNNVFRFSLNFEIGTGYEVVFKINEEVISDQSIDGSSFTRQFTPGRYQTCIKVITPDCPNGKETCKELVVEPICPGITFTHEQLAASTTYRFTPEVTGINGDINIAWFVNDIFIKNVLLTSEYVDFELEPGVNKICAKIETDQCPDGVQFCDEVNVQ